MSAEETVVGVDACKRGWVAVVLGPDGIRGHVLAHIADLDSMAPEAAMVGIDIPIGLPTVAAREADGAARAFLDSRGSSVFPVLVREAYEASTFEAAQAVNRLALGVGHSMQAWMLREKILEVDAWVATTALPVREVHPEVSFRAMLEASIPSKKSWAGMRARVQGLAAEGIDLDPLDVDAISTAGVDDVLDAAAAAWSARRVLEGRARCFPSDPPVHGGRPVAIWA